MFEFQEIYGALSEMLIVANKVDVGEWHAQDVSDQPLLVTRECRNMIVTYDVPGGMSALQKDVSPNLPFAEAQFQDRVSGEPLNPPPSADLWPYNNQGHKAHLEKAGGKFSHTYPERFWPKRAGAWASNAPVGIRYPAGDLSDMVIMLAQSPYTRQAYLPVWFPEDTGNMGVRLPCTLGYHFLLRGTDLHMTYFIRSCDFVRHFRDDLYMACRLLQWVLEKLQPTAEQWGSDQITPTEELWAEVTPGTLTMHIVSLHCMEGDLPKMRRDLRVKND